MREEQVRQAVLVRNPQGIHARPAYLIAETAARFRSRVEIIKNSESIDAKSIISLLTLGATCGTELVIQVTGQDSREAISELVGLFETGFSEMHDSPEGLSTENSK